MKDKKVKQVLWYQWEEGGHKEKVKEREYGRSAMYSHMARAQ
jgi:hypothetical protein